jgi:putative membrane protein
VIGWQLEPAILIPLAVTAAWYGRGVRRVWLATDGRRGVPPLAVMSFAAGLLALAVALVSPLHELGHVSFAAHMIQHEVLMIVAAPLLVMGRPHVAFAWTLPGRWLRRAGLALPMPVRRTGSWLLAPMTAWFIHALALWTWHVPALFQATLTSDVVHAAQHTTFLTAALVFWWALISRHRRPGSAGTSVLYLFTTALHTGLLGALLTFAPHPWYPAYAAAANPFGLSVLEDQQLGGLIMWIPASLVFVAAGLGLFIEWLREAERRAGRSGAPVWVGNGH